MDLSRAKLDEAEEPQSSEGSKSEDHSKDGNKDRMDHDAGPRLALIARIHGIVGQGAGHGPAILRSRFGCICISLGIADGWGRYPVARLESFGVQGFPRDHRRFLVQRVARRSRRVCEGF